MFARMDMGGSGGEDHVNLGISPDAKWSSNGSTLANNGTANVTVTQKPRFIVLVMFSNSNAGQGLWGIYDVEKNQAYRYGFWSSSVQDANWTNYNLYIKSVTATNVSIKNSYGGSCRVWVNCYY